MGGPSKGSDVPWRGGESSEEITVGAASLWLRVRNRKFVLTRNYYVRRGDTLSTCLEKHGEGPGETGRESSKNTKKVLEKQGESPRETEFFSRSPRETGRAYNKSVGQIENIDLAHT